MIKNQMIQNSMKNIFFLNQKMIASFIKLLNLKVIMNQLNNYLYYILYQELLIFLMKE